LPQISRMEKRHTLIAIGEHILIAGLLVIMANAGGIILEYSLPFFFGFILMTALPVIYYMKQRPSGYIMLNLRNAPKTFISSLTVTHASIGGLVLILLVLSVIGVSARTFYDQASTRTEWWVYGSDFWWFYLSVHFGLCGLIMLFILQFGLRISMLRHQTWKRFTENWLQFSGISAIAVGGFGFVAANQSTTSLMNITIDPQYVDLKLMTGLYILAIVLYACAGVCATLGRNVSPNDEKTCLPHSFFIPAFLFAWTANWVIYTLFIDSVMLTLHAHATG
jgi:hypothetical protein